MKKILLGVIGALTAMCMFGCFNANTAMNIFTSSEAKANGETVDKDGVKHYYKYFKIYEIPGEDGSIDYNFDLDYMMDDYKDAYDKVEGEIIIPDGVTSFCNFSGFDKVTKVVIPDSVTVLDRNQFSNCDALEEVVLPDTMTTLKGYSFWQCYNLHKVVLPKSLKHLNEGADVGYDMQCDVYFPAEVELETYNSKSMFDVLFTSMPFGSKVRVFLVKDSWMDKHFAELYIDESNDTYDGEYHNYPEVLYWDGVNTQ